MNLRQECILCKRVRNLQLSHLIPRFVTKYLKQIGSSGYIRNQLGIRTQDTPKMYILCHDCEEKLSIFETYFSKTFLKRIVLNPGSQISIEYNYNLKRFILTMSWRILYYYLQEFRKEGSGNQVLEYLFEKWRRYILSLNKIPIEESFYMICWGECKKAEEILQISDSEKRNLDACKHLTILTSFHNSEPTVPEFLFIQIPHFTFFTVLSAEQLKGFQNFQIDNDGVYDLNEKIKDEWGFWAFYNSKVRDIKEITIHRNEIEKIDNSILRKNQTNQHD